MAWFPNNNHPRDKATYDFHITVPGTHTALGNGELVGATVDNADGTPTWNWHDGYPTATYLTTRHGRRLRLHAGRRRDRARRASGNALGALQRLESTFTAATRRRHAEHRRRRARTRSSSSSPTTIGAPLPVRLDRRGRRPPPSSLGYVLEVQTKSTSRRQLDQPQHARARDRAPVVRRQRLGCGSGATSGSTRAGRPGGPGTGPTSRTARIDAEPAVHQQLQRDDQPDALERRRRPSCRRAGGPVRHVPGLHAPGDDDRGPTPDRRRARRSSRSEGAGRPSYAYGNARPGRSSSPWPSRIAAEKARLRGLQPGQARHATSSSGCTASAKPTLTPDDVLPEHDGAERHGRRHGAGDALADAGRAADVRRLHAGRRRRPTRPRRPPRSPRPPVTRR